MRCQIVGKYADNHSAMCYFTVPYIQLLVVCATMEMFVLLMDPTSMRAEWRCVSMISGELSVMISGTQLMLLLCASNLDSHFLGVSVFACLMQYSTEFYEQMV